MCLNIQRNSQFLLKVQTNDFMTIMCINLCVLEEEGEKPLVLSSCVVGVSMSLQKGRREPRDEGCRWRDQGSLLPVQLSLCELKQASVPHST